MADLNVATTIVMQLGGFKFMSMTGARHFVGGNDGVKFNIPTVTRPAGKINKIIIRLTPMDTYAVEFWYGRKDSRRGYLCDLVTTLDDVYADNLQDVFTHHTGLDTHL